MNESALNCPTCGAPVDYLDEQVLRGRERRAYRSYQYQQPPPVDMREMRLEAIEQFVGLVKLEAERPDMDARKALDAVLETLRQQVRGHHVRG